MEELRVQGFFPQFWEPVYSGLVEAQPIPDREGRFYPIGSIGIPVLLSSQLVAIGLTNDALPESWRWGGVARQAINAGLTVGAATNVSYASKSLLLNKLNLVAFPAIASEYALSIDIPRWVLKVNVQVFEYTGDIESVLTRIEEINFKLDIISGGG